MDEEWIYIPPEERQQYQDELNKLYRELVDSMEVPTETEE